MESCYKGESLCFEDNAASDITLFLKRSRDLSAIWSCRTGSLIVVWCIGLEGTAWDGPGGRAAWQRSSLGWAVRGGGFVTLPLTFVRQCQPPQQQYDRTPAAQKRVSTRVPMPIEIPTIWGVLNSLSFSSNACIGVMLVGGSNLYESGRTLSILWACWINFCLESSLKFDHSLTCHYF